MAAAPAPPPRSETIAAARGGAFAFSKTRQRLARLALLAAAVFVSACSQPEIAVHLPRPEHGLHFDTPATVWDEALPLGNGIMGALVWGDGLPLKISLDRSDLWDLRPVPEFQSDEYRFELMRRWHEQGRTADLIRVYEDPYRRPAPTKIPAGRIELTLGGEPQFKDTALSLIDATAGMSFKQGPQVQVRVHAVEPVGLIDLQGAQPSEIKLVAPAFGGKAEGRREGEISVGDLAQLGYPAPEQTAGDTWRAYRQQGAEGFHYAVYLAWRRQGDLWRAAWSIASSFEGNDPLQLARDRVQKALEAGPDNMAASHLEWWLDYWRKSSLRIPNPILQRQWFLEQYKFGSASRRGAPPISLQAVWTADDGRLPPWKGDYHHDLNTQLSYWPCYTGNHLEEGLSYLDYLWNTRPAAFDWTKRFFGLPGMNVPMTADLNGNQIGGWRQYTHSSTTAAWLAHHFYLHWKYSGDREFLAHRAYPYLRDAATFLEAFTAAKGPDGRRTLPLSASPEINDNRPEAWFPTVTNYDLALVRWLLAAAAEMADDLDQTADAARWRGVLSEMPDFSYADDGRLLVAKDYPLPESHRHFSHLMAIHPLGLIDVTDGPAAERTIAASLSDLDRLGTDRWTGYSFAWLANLAARARDGGKAETALEIFSTAFTLRNSFHCNGDQSGKGYSAFHYRPFTLEGNFAAAAGVQEMLLQSHRGQILIFPAIPDSWKDVSFTTLRAQGAFLVSAERTGGVTRRVEITSENGGRCTLVSPFTGKAVSFEMQPGERRVLTSDPS